MSEAIAVEQWVRVARVEDFPSNAGACVKWETSRSQYSFCLVPRLVRLPEHCPHKRDMVLSRGLIGDQEGTPKVACPQHKKTFSLIDGSNLGGEEYNINIYPVKVEQGFVYIGAGSASN